MGVYPTMAEALEALNQMRRQMAQKICPLLRKECDARCMAYYEGMTKKCEFDKGFYAYGPACNSPLIRGEIQVINNYC
jgi:hypothetical protein